MAFLLWSGQTEAVKGQTVLRVAEYNCENFFDCRHDAGKNDTQYLPESPRRWTPHRYWQKVHNIGKVVLSMGNERPVDLIALTEVENDSVMTDLCRKSVLRRLGYHYIMTDSPDRRGIDVALMFLPEAFSPLDSTALRIKDDTTPGLLTRDMLYVAGRLRNGDTLHVYVVHLSSRLHGAESERYRKVECNILMRHIKALQARHPDARIMILGDFNDNPSSKTIRESLNAQPATSDTVGASAQELYNLSWKQHAGHGIGGTYKYDGRWEIIDQCIVSGALLQPLSSTWTRRSNLHLWAPAFIMEHDNEGRGLKPRRTYNGFKYQAGYSDHLPFYIDLCLNFKPVAQP